MQRNLGIDLFRMLAIFTVVLIHSASTHIAFRDEVLQWLPPANASFAFLAGWYMFKPSSDALSLRDIGGLLSKRLRRLMIPYLVWEVIYVLANMCFDLMGGGTVNPPMGTDWIGIVFFGAGSVQLWFVIMLVYVQIALYGVMSVMVATGQTSFARGLPTAVFFVMLAIVALLWRVNGIENDYLCRFVFLLGYGALGVGFRRAIHDVSNLDKKVIRIFIVFIGGGLVAVSRFFNIPGPVRVLAWCLTFGCMPIHASLQKWVTCGSGAVMGIYLCHVLFTRVIAMGVPFVSRVITNGYALVIFNAIIGFSASLAFVLLVKRTRLQRYLSI